MKFLRISRVANHYSEETSSGLLTGIYASFVGVWNLDFSPNNLHSILLASKSLNTTRPLFGLSHFSLPTCPDSYNLHTSYSPLLRL